MPPYVFPTPHSRPPSDIFFEHTVYAIMPPKQQEQEEHIDKEAQTKLEWLLICNVSNLSICNIKEKRDKGA